jgi:hypothetical protein
MRMSFGPALTEVDGARFLGGGRPMLGDVDGDGVADLVVVGDGLGVAVGERDGGFGPQQQRDLAPVLGASAPVVGGALGEFDGDDGDELVVAAGDEARTALFLVDRAADGELSAREFAALPRGELQLHAIDLAHDGALDLVALGGGEAPVVFAFAGDGRGGFTPLPAASLAVDGPILAPRLLDLDGDGALDVVARGEQGLLAFAGDAGGAFAPGRVVTPLAVDVVALGDLDRDRRTDLLALTDDGRLVVVALDAGGASPSTLAAVTSAAAVDLDGDGWPELVAAREAPYAAAGTATLAVGRRREDGRFSFAEVPIAAGRVHAIRGVDADGDGAVDLALFDEQGLTIVRRAP